MGYLRDYPLRGAGIMKAWQVQVYCQNMRGDRIWSFFSDRELDMLNLPQSMTLNRGVKEMIRVYNYINRALHMRLYNTLTGEEIPIELLQ